jgi:microcystin-dependent protein
LPETETPALKLRKPEIGGSNDVWGNRINDNMDKIDTAVGSNTTLATNALKKSGLEAERTMDDIIVYKDGLVIPPGEPDALVTQRAVKDLINALLPIGTIIMWAGTVATIPAGWALCNGQVVNGNTTPNLINRFIVAGGDAGAYWPPGTLGGSLNATYSGRVGGTYLAQSQMPVHNHAVYDPAHIHGVGDYGHTHVTNAGGAATQGFGDTGGRVAAHGGTTSSTGYASIWMSSAATGIGIYNSGGGDWHDHAFGINIPWNQYYPLFYSMCFIMKVALA